MSKEKNKIVEFDRLNAVGKAVFIAGTAFTTIGTIVDYTVSTIGDIWTAAEEAFAEGSSDNIEEAVVLEEHDSPEKGSS